MEQQNMNAPNVRNIQDHPIKVILSVMVLISSGAWAFARSWVVEDLSDAFTTKSEMNIHNVERLAEATAFNTRFDTIDTKLNKLISKDERSDAYNIISSIEGDIKRHEKIRNDSPAWIETERQLDERFKMAIRHRDCVMDGRENCSAIKENIWK